LIKFPEAELPRSLARSARWFIWSWLRWQSEVVSANAHLRTWCAVWRSTRKTMIRCVTIGSPRLALSCRLWAF